MTLNTLLLAIRISLLIKGASYLLGGGTGEDSPLARLWQLPDKMLDITCANSVICREVTRLIN